MKKDRMGCKRMVSCLLVIFCFCLTACGAEEGAADRQTPEKAMETAMESVQALDLDTFNKCTDNYVKTYKNWLGIPTEREYRIFNELQQPGIKKGRKYKANKRFAEAVVRNLTWEIKEVQEEEEQAQITMEITNTDMSDAMGKYIIHLMEGLVNSEGTGIKQLIEDLAEIDYDKRGLALYVEEAEGSYSQVVTVTAKKEQGAWKIQLNDAFINAVMGNLDAEEYSQEVQGRLDELEHEYEEKMDQWGEEFEDKVENWVERVFE
jgi:hypothetical protein